MQARDNNTTPGESSHIQIETLCEAHLEAILDIHLTELNSGLTSHLGRDFASKMYLQMLETGWGFVAVSKSTSEIQGFIFAGRNFRFFKCLNLETTFRVIPFTIVKPHALADILASVLHQLYVKFVVSPTQKKDVVELSNFAVTEASKSKGVGSTLIAAFEKKALLDGCSTVMTNTQNERLVQFYMQTRNANQNHVSKLFRRKIVFLIWEL